MKVTTDQIILGVYAVESHIGGSTRYRLHTARLGHLVPKGSRLLATHAVNSGVIHTEADCPLTSEDLIERLAKWYEVNKILDEAGTVGGAEHYCGAKAPNRSIAEMKRTSFHLV